MSREALSYIPISVAVCRLPCVAVDNRKLMALSLAQILRDSALGNPLIQ